MTPEIIDVDHVIAEGAVEVFDRSFLTDADREDIQALVLFGTKSPFLRYHFFAVRDARGARDFVAFLLEQGPLAVNTAGKGQAAQEREHLVYAGFTWSGLVALGLAPLSLQSFPVEFREGARQRAVALGDVSEQDIETWTISDAETHLVVLLYARDREELFNQSTALLAAADRNGCALVQYLDAAALPDGRHPSGQQIVRGVHFGFSDGISQPAIAGEPGVPTGGPAPIKAGAFLLGHGDSAVPETNHASLNPPELGVNGTFGAFRLFEQDCDAFEDFLDRNSTDSSSREMLAARMCGRWRNGISLAVSPDAPYLTTTVTAAELNGFDYVPTEQHPQMPDDAAGRRCPIGSHVRRANPRSGEILGQIGQTIRLIRRGMPYGPPHVRGDGKKRGMLGLFLCASLKDQFEFVMRHWMNDGLFARGLNPAEKDPFVGASADGTFTYRTEDGPSTVSGLSRFITTRGAAYLFFPSRTALRLLASGSVVPRQPDPGSKERPPAPAAVAPPPQPPDPEKDPIGFIVDNIRRRVGNSTNRDAHPKHHGLVKARFAVLGADDIPAEQRAPRRALAHGIFGRPQTFTAYIRFSNGNPLRLTPDGEPDLRGMAIKLFDVSGPKLADEKSTQDFILASDPRFFVKNLKDYPTFLTTTSRLALVQRFPLLREVFRSHENPLTIRYFSQTPYACGPDLAVKYSVVPRSPVLQAPVRLSEEEIASRGANFLRDAMAATLAAQDVAMDFMVQLVTDPGLVDDATALVTTDFITVARITIPRQEFRSKAQMTLAENISFNPWHAIEEHRPLGSINEARKRVYETIAELRHANGGVIATEPTGHEL
jgi:Dyp-type peroxidase family